MKVGILFLGLSALLFSCSKVDVNVSNGAGAAYLSSITQYYQANYAKDSFIYDNHHNLIEIINYQQDTLGTSSPGIESIAFTYSAGNPLPHSYTTTLVSGYIGAGSSARDTLMYDGFGRLVEDSGTAPAIALHVSYVADTITFVQTYYGIPDPNYQPLKAVLDNGNITSQYIHNAMLADFQYTPFSYPNPRYNPATAYSLGVLFYYLESDYISDIYPDFISINMPSSFSTYDASTNSSVPQLVTYLVLTDDKERILQQLFSGQTDRAIYRYQH